MASCKSQGAEIYIGFVGTGGPQAASSVPAACMACVVSELRAGTGSKSHTTAARMKLGITHSFLEEELRSFLTATT